MKQSTVEIPELTRLTSSSDETLNPFVFKYLLREKESGKLIDLTRTI